MNDRLRNVRNSKVVTIISLFIVGLTILFSGQSGKLSLDSRSSSNIPGITRLPLMGEWHFRQAGQDRWYKAKVPGCVHTDLMGNDLIPDPFYRDNELKVQWVEKEDWEYRREFEVSGALIEKRHVELVCEGLDTYAIVFLNGEKIAGTDNMFRGYRFEVKPFLKNGNNEIRVIFKSPVNHARAQEAKLPYKLPGVSPHARKAHYHFGWDWGPRLVTSGIWRPLYIEAWENARIQEMEVTQHFQEMDSVTLNVKLTILSDLEGQAKIKTLISGKKKHLKDKSITLKKGVDIQDISLAIADPELWWPAGMGEQNLYTVEVYLERGKHILDSVSKRTGIRKLILEQKSDRWGKSFQFSVNGIPFFAKGGNWIPGDMFLNRVTPEKYRDLLEDCVEANMNMLRVWGGGIYEAPEFYDLCDEMGITVWQDFMFACSMYPGDEAFLRNVQDEAEYVVKLLRHHPCISLWCGNNECEEGWFHWGWKKFLPQKVWEDYEKIFHQILPRVVEELDPQRQYWPSSPHAEKIGEPRSERSGDMHYWGIWHGKEPFKEYRKKFHRFMSEFGFQSFPLIETVKTFTFPDDRNITSPVMEHHQKHPMGNKLIFHYMLDHYRLPEDFEALLWLSQVLQAEGMKIAVEHFRCQMPRIMGSLYWQVNDCWQVASWSGIDYLGTWKALHHYAKRFYAPVLIAPIDTEELLEVFCVSDYFRQVDSELHWAVYTYSGNVVQEHTLPVRIEPRKNSLILTKSLEELKKHLKENEVYFYCELRAENCILSSNVFHFSELKRVSLPDPRMKKEIHIQEGRVVVSLRCEKFAKDVYLSAHGFRGRFSDNFFDMIPGKEYRIEFEAEEKVDTSKFKDVLKVISLRDTY